MEVASKADYLVDFGGENDPLRKRFDHHQQGGAGVQRTDLRTRRLVSCGKNMEKNCAVAKVLPSR